VLCNIITFMRLLLHDSLYSSGLNNPFNSLIPSHLKPSSKVISARQPIRIFVRNPLVYYIMHIICI